MSAAMPCSGGTEAATPAELTPDRDIARVLAGENVAIAPRLPSGDNLPKLTA